MQVAITGGTGFIGKALVARHLAAGDSVRVLSRRSTQDSELPAAVGFFQGDLSGETDALIPFLDGIDVLFHCAGEIRDQGKMVSLHINGTQNLCTAAAGKISRWVQLSSTGAYGLRRQGTVTEQSPERPVGIYEKTKAEADRIVREMSASAGFSWTILRPSIVYGPGMPNQSLFQMVSMIQRGLFFYIGRERAMANYIHVDNVVAAMMAAAAREEARGSTYILSEYVVLDELVGRIAARLGRNAPTTRLPEGLVRLLTRVAEVIPGFPLSISRIDALTSQVVYSGELARRELGPVHVIPLLQGIEQLVDSWLESRGRGKRS